jgi:hypothetical protein
VTSLNYFFSACGSSYSAPLLRPTFLTAADEGKAHAKIIAGLQLVTIANIPDGSPRLYLHLFCEFLLSCLMYALLYAYSRKV